MAARLLLPGIVGAIALTLGACGSAREPTVVDRSANTILITAAQIEASGATTAWDAVRRAAPQVETVETGGGRPVSMRRRGRASIQLSDAPLVILDGVRLTNWRDLDLVPATTVAMIEILNGIDGSARYGQNAVGGVIVVYTKT